MDIIQLILQQIVYFCGGVMACLPFFYIGYIIYLAIRSSFRQDSMDDVVLEKEKPKQDKLMPRVVNTSNTDVCLRAIEHDFPEYNYAEVQGMLLNPLIVEYFQIKYGKIKFFKKTLVDKTIYNGIPKAYANNVSCLKLHQAAVIGYDRTPTHAIVTYQVSLGYVENSMLKEVLFTINHSLTLSNKSATLHTVECPNCGAELQSVKSQVCLYCKRPIIRDTKRFWRFSSIVEEDGSLTHL